MKPDYSFRAKVISHIEEWERRARYRELDDGDKEELAALRRQLALMDASPEEADAKRK